MARPRHQSGWITESGRTIYGNFWRYFVDSTSGEQKRKQVSLPLGQVGKMKKWEAKEKLKSLIAEDLGPKQSVERPDPKTTFAWFVRYRYLPMREGRWHQATKEKTTYEIERYLVEQFGDLSIEQVTQFELQIHLNRLAKEFSDSIREARFL